MKKVIICLYVLWAVLAISSLFLWGNWWVATSFLWIPLSVVVSVAFYSVVGSMVISKREARAEANEEPSCKNCLFGVSADLINATRKEGEQEQCLGEKVYGAKKGILCSHYMRK